MASNRWREGHLERQRTGSTGDDIGSGVPILGRAALRLTDRLTARSAQIEEFPDSGRIVPEFENRYIRELIDGDYRTIYERFPDRVEIISVISGRMSFGEA